MSTLAATLGVLGGLGVLLIALGLRPGPPRTDTARPDRREWATSWQLPSPERVGGMAGAGLLVLVVTRWPVIAVAAAATVWWLTKGEKRTLSSQIDKTDALATWAEQLRDATGTPRGIEGVIVTTTDTAPQPIRAAVTRFAERLKYRTICRCWPTTSMTPTAI